MAYGLSDIVQQRRMIDESTGAGRVQAGVDRQARCAGRPCETASCRRTRLLGYFGETPTAAKCGNCDNCLSPPVVRDGKVAAQKLLSCVYRTGQRFGAMHLIDVLVGRLTERVTQFGHDKLSVFGDRRRTQRKAMARRDPPAGGDGPSGAGQRGLWRAEADGVRARRAEGRDRGDAARAGGRQPRPRRQEQITARRTCAHVAGQAEPPTQPGRRAEGVAFRSGAHRGVPAYVVLHDATIDGIAASRPATLTELRGIPGIGDKKLEHYGDELIALVKADRAEA